MKRILQTLVILLAALMVPTTAVAAYVQLADGVYQDGTTLYIGSSVTTLGNLQVNPSEIYCYAQIPPSCLYGTFTGYGATLHVPTSAMVSYFTTQYWNNFNNVLADAVEPLSVVLNNTSAEIEIGVQFSLSAIVIPSYATPSAVTWYSSNSAIATVSDGTVTAVGPGECDIIAQCAVMQAVCHVHITVIPEFVTINLDRHEAFLLPNHLMSITASCSPTETDLVVWSSDNSVAMPRLVNGTIQVLGLKEGSATITVGSADGTAYTDTCNVTVYTKVGDLNSDGYVNMDDLTVMINYLLTSDATGVNLSNADANLIGGVTMDDLTAFINYLLTNEWPWDGLVNETFTVNGVSFTMVPVESGTFMMGASDSDAEASNDEKPSHEVTLSDYYIGETEVTQELWMAVMGNNPSNFTPSYNYDENLQRPVETVSWEDCQEFFIRLNQMTNRKFRLPTEAEWEYAARGGNRSKGYKYSGSDSIDDVAWIQEGSDGPTHATATKDPNELGLYDMSGNVYEWCQDWYGSYSGGVQTNPTGPIFGSYRVVRGGCWAEDNANGCRVSHRYYTYGEWADVGLRLALDTNNGTNFGLSESVAEVMLGHSIEIDILNGNGNYSIVSDSEFVNCTLNSNSLTVKGKSAGNATVYVTDLATDSRVQLKVIVKDKDVITVNGVSFTMVAVEGGSFMMGANDNDTEAYDDERPAHQVSLSSFCIGETEVTQELWKAVMGSNPSYHYGSRHPVEEVGWEGCLVFINKLNELTGRTFRLPTEAEWEYAARGGNKSKGYLYSGSNNLNDVACYRANAPYYGGRSTENVATKAPNELGIYDMSGNVWEWCFDWYGSYSEDPQINPTGPESGPRRVSRGGSYLNNPVSCRVSNRNISSPSGLVNGRQGLRLAL